MLLMPHNAILGGKRSKIRFIMRRDGNVFIMRRGRKAREVEVRGEVEQSKGRQHELQGEGGRGDFQV